MWSLLFKLSGGVLKISTADGVRYVALDRLERLRLLWTFRHFRVLPAEVFPGQMAHIERLLARERVWGFHLKDIEPYVIGTVDAIPQRP